MDATYITITTLDDQASADLLVRRLAAEGLDAVAERHSDLAVRPAEGSLGTVDVQVREDHVDAARRLVDAAEDGRLDPGA